MQANLDLKTVEVTKLKQELDETRQKVNEVEAQLETAQREVKDANRERSSAVKAKVFAEQQMTSVEYEYEQHKARASRREKELVEQLENLGNDETVKILKEKLHTMTEKVNSLETQMWQDEKKHKADLDMIRANVVAEVEKNKSLSSQIISLRNIQNEYDEVSGQLVDSIQENDQLKRQREALNATITDLSKKVTDFEAQRTSQMASHKMADDLQAQLKQQGLNHATELQTLEEKHQKEMAIVENKYNDAMDDVHKLIAELDASYKETYECQLKYNDLYSDYTQLEHENNLLGNTNQQCAMTIDCLKKEMEILRSTYSALHEALAQQELDNYRLQRTICELNDTINASIMNMSASNSMMNTTQECSNNIVPRDETIASSEEPNVERDGLASQLETQSVLELVQCHCGGKAAQEQEYASMSDELK